MEASSGKTVRHRLNRGGNRKANHALHVIVPDGMRRDDRTRAYVAREAYRALPGPRVSRHASGRKPRDARVPVGMTQREVAERIGTEGARTSEVEREAGKHHEVRDRYGSLLGELAARTEFSLDTQ